jgi:TniQ
MNAMYANIPAPLPDECLRSYGFRISAMNAKPIGHLEKLLPNLIKVTGLDPAFLVHHHTNLGYLRFVSGDFSQLDISTHPDLLTNFRVYFGALSTDVSKFCPSCAEEDFDFHGVSYWRRTHQIPGIDHCSKHMESLEFLRQDAMCKFLPRNSLPTQICIPQGERESYFDSPYIRNFSALGDLALHRRIPLNPAIITRTLTRQYFSKLGEYRGQLTALAIKNFPETWLKRHFPQIFNNPKSAIFPAVDEVLRSSRTAYATKLYLLAMSLLWDNPDEAMQACLHEAANNSSGFNEIGGVLALRDVLQGTPIVKSCRRHGIQFRDFEHAFRIFLTEIKPYSEAYLAQLKLH